MSVYSAMDLQVFDLHVTNNAVANSIKQDFPWKTHKKISHGITQKNTEKMT
jgi:hypothetical protein